MKRNLLSITLLSLVLTLFASCGGLGGLSPEIYGKQLVKTIGSGNLESLMKLDPEFKEVYTSYVNTAKKEAQVQLFLIDMAARMEKSEPGCLNNLRLLLDSDNSKLAEKGLLLGKVKFMIEVANWAGAIDPETVFRQIFTTYE